METSSKIPDDFIEVGKSYALFIRDNHGFNKRVHILAIVDDDMIVYKHWVKSRRQWQYKIDHISLFEMWYAEDWIKT